MGEAILAALISRGLSTPQNIAVSDVSEARRQYLQQKYKVSVTADNRAAVEKADIVVLAIKPQTLAGVMPELNGRLKPGQLVLSIIAGARINTLKEGLNHQAIVRSMPNTPAQVGEGMTVWTATPEVTPVQKQQATAILGVMGREIYFDDEKYLDMATAVSGSGPAYFFYFVECLIEAAMQIGLAPDVATALVLQTMHGSAHLIEKSGKSPAELRQIVTSPGGTTAAALRRMEEGGFAGLVSQAVKAAYERAKELGK